mmetsp:Transcript_27419/g.38558  ORF Transcript_27419/g.38558 Transcript_27419/m.38558 type:complete len:116 (+) Transcript_27419:178-525(+)
MQSDCMVDNSSDSSSSINCCAQISRGSACDIEEQHQQQQSLSSSCESYTTAVTNLPDDIDIDINNNGNRNNTLLVNDREGNIRQVLVGTPSPSSLQHSDSSSAIIVTLGGKKRRK